MTSGQEHATEAGLEQRNNDSDANHNRDTNEEASDEFVTGSCFCRIIIMRRFRNADSTDTTQEASDEFWE